MSYLVGATIIILGLLISIALHELGHLIPAKLFKVPVTQYMVGFGPTLWSRRCKETEYGFKAIPLGGYIRMLGMFLPPRVTTSRVTTAAAATAEVTAADATCAEASENPAGGSGAAGAEAGKRNWWQYNVHMAKVDAWRELPNEAMRKRAFYRLSVPKKLTVMFGGPFMNLVLAAVLIAIVYSGIGIYAPSTTISAVNECVATAGGQECAPTDPAGPAYAAGMQPGDRVLQINGADIESWQQLQQVTSQLSNQPHDFVIERDGQRQQISVTPLTAEVERLNADGELVTEEVSIIGALPSYELTGQPLSTVPALLWERLSLSAEMVVTLPQRVFDMGEVLVTDKPRDEQGVVGVVGIVRVAGEITSMDETEIDPLVRVGSLLEIMASLNIALFIFNMIPLLPLDGGHIFGALYEGVRNLFRKRGQPRYYFDTAQLMPVAYVVFMALLLAGLVIILADIFKPITLT